MNVAGIEVAENGLIRTFDLGSKAEILPSSIAGSESTYKWDYHWCNDDYVEKRMLIVGSYANGHGLAGLGAFVSIDGVGAANPDVGFRSSVRV